MKTRLLILTIGLMWVMPWGAAGQGGFMDAPTPDHRLGPVILAADGYEDLPGGGTYVVTRGETYYFPAGSNTGIDCTENMKLCKDAILKDEGGDPPADPGPGDGGGGGKKGGGLWKKLFSGKNK